MTTSLKRAISAPFSPLCAAFQQRTGGCALQVVNRQLEAVAKQAEANFRPHSPVR